jgi:formylglycine-generating enzyme required for sulfatase activity
MRPAKKRKNSTAGRQGPLVGVKGGTIRDIKLVNKAETVIFCDSPPPAGFDPQVLAPYLDYLIELCRVVPLRGVRREERRERGDPQRWAEDPDRRLELERIFVELDTTRMVELKDLPAGKRPASRDPRQDPEPREPKARPLPALEALGACPSRHAVLHGAPGCGKSTFVRFLVLALAHCGRGRQRAWLPRLPGWPAEEAALLPIRIELRHFAAWLQERKITESEPCHLWDYFSQALTELQTKNSWLELLPAVDHIARTGRAIFLLDGLDEVPGGKGKLFVRDCLEKFAAGEIGKASRIVVTCRTRSYEADFKGRNLRLFEPDPVAPRQPEPDARTQPKDPLKAAAGGRQTTAFELAPFDDPKKRRFIEAWYKALVELGEVEPGRAGDRVRALQAAVCNPRNEKLAELARNPLLLTVIAHLHSSQRDLELPDNRAELFYDLIDLLLTRWAERHARPSEGGATDGIGETLGDLLQDPGVRGFEIEHLLQLVAELAHDHYRGGQAQTLILIPAATLRRRLVEQHHDPDLELGAAWAERVMNFIQYRAGLLNSPDGGENYDFPHSLLGEYLAAFHLARQRRSSEQAAGKVTVDGNWDEVVRLVAGHHVFVRKETRDALDLVEELCGPAQSRSQQPATDLEWRRVALAADILHEMGPERLERERRQGPACRDLVRGLLEGLVEQGALPARDRARTGMILGQLGDRRRGVGLRPDRLPDLDWIDIPPGPFIMGSKKGETQWEDETPQFECNLITKPYRISRYPVTVAQFQAFIEAGGYADQARDWWTDEGWKWKEGNKISGPEDYGPAFRTANHPRVGVSWFEAVAFCRWLSEKRQQPISLPSEVEWERAARHTDARAYPWPDPTDKGDVAADLARRCNMGETGIGHTSAVGMFPNGRAQCGAADMAGNVWEWCRTKWVGDYRDYAKNVDETQGGTEQRVLRGGSWVIVIPGRLRCSCRRYGAPDRRSRYRGFRCVGWLGGSAPG